MTGVAIPLRAAIVSGFVALVAACAPSTPAQPPADLLITNAKVYTFAWDEPSTDGSPATNAPRDGNGWHPDAQAVAIRGDRITYVGTAEGAQALRGEATRVVDLGGATLLPGFVDTHTHVVELGLKLQSVDLTGVATEADAVAKVAAAAAKTPKGQWIVGRGWDEGAWANRYPTLALLSEKVPDHPVLMESLHGFAAWGNRLAFAAAKITRDTKAPVGGEIRRDAKGEPSGTVLNRAVPLLRAAVPAPTPAQYEATVLAGLTAMARSGFTAVHEAGVDRQLLTAYESLNAKKQLPVRVYVMLSARDPELCREWIARGPTQDPNAMLVVRSVKAYYDGSLGSRGAKLLADYADLPGSRGISGAGYGFDQQIVADMMRAGFQVGVHAIGDAGNRETLDFFDGVLKADARARAGRHRIEHAQVVSPEDIPRFAAMDIVAAMQPPHAVEDKPWAEARVGPERIKGAYAWRTLRTAGARVVFGSDLAGSDHSLFYGLHAAMTRRDKERQPDGGWYPEQRFTPEEAVRAYSTWAAYAAFREQDGGPIAVGRTADLSAIDVDPLVAGETSPGDLLEGTVTLTVVAGKVVAP
jgi:predicted amidohydrolase YtcJ